MLESRDSAGVACGHGVGQQIRTVVIDALAARYGGAAYATLHMASELADDPDIAGVVLITRAGSLVAEGASSRADLRLVALPEARRLELVRRVTWQAVRLPRLLRAESPAVLVTWSGMLPRRSRSPVICYLANPLVFARGGLGNRLRRWAVRRTASAATHVLVPTAGMGEFVERELGRRPDVAPLGVDRAAFRPAASPGDEILCVGDPYRHKRHEVLLAAWSALRAPRPRLRLIGDLRVDRGHAANLTRLVRRHRADGEIVLQTGLAHDELVRAYHAARVFVLTSEHESFCLPLLEAQACGVPAVVRDLPALRESSGGAAVFVSGDDPGAWAAAVTRLLTDDAAHAAARAAGLANAERSGWERTAAAIRDRTLA
jgi:glycosyltransferase involved in cell wall biosynthesis